MGVILPWSCGGIGVTKTGFFRFTTISYHTVCQVELKIHCMLFLYDHRTLQAEFFSGVTSVFIGDFTCMSQI